MRTRSRPSNRSCAVVPCCSPAKERTNRLASVRGKWFSIAGISALILLFLFHFSVVLHQEPWEDEVFGASTGLSIARAQGQTLSVLADYPHTGSPIPFYGPVSFYAEAALIRAFGLSWFTWRLACFLGIVGCAAVCAALVRAAGGDRWAQLATAFLILLSTSVGGTFPGRWDYITTGVFLSGLLIFLTAVTKRTLWRALPAGVLIGLALAS